MSRWLVIMEVSQKQAFIFSTNKLSENVFNSSVIAMVTDPTYFERIIEDRDLYDTDKNLVYAGGGHTVLEFPEREQAVQFIRQATRITHQNHPELELFATIREYDEKKKPGENLEELTKRLERKKSVRQASFHQGTFGVEKIDANTLSPVMVCDSKKEKEHVDDFTDKLDKKVIPQDYDLPKAFDQLGGVKDDSNFIAVVHIDGNGMGKRVKDCYEENRELPWDEFKKKIRDFSESIRDDYEDAFKQMNITLIGETYNNKLINENLKLKEKKLPVRRVISSGDDICFVCEGRIGIECAATFLKILAAKNNKEDGEAYYACGGVAIVHQKYPFFKAYDLAEELCSQAKKKNAALRPKKNGEKISSIDWHLETGEIRDSLDEIREHYLASDKETRLELRPYIVATGDESVWKDEPVRDYNKFKKLLKWMLDEKDDAVRGKLKEMRPQLLKGADAAEYYLRFNRLDNTSRAFRYYLVGDDEAKPWCTTVNTSDEQKRSIYYDAVEILDTYIPFNAEED